MFVVWLFFACVFRMASEFMIWCVGISANESVSVVRMPAPCILPGFLHSHLTSKTNPDWARCRCAEPMDMLNVPESFSVCRLRALILTGDGAGAPSPWPC